MTSLKRIGFTVLLSVFLFSACDLDDEQADFWAAALSEPSGFTEITADGTVVSEDPEDWRTSPVYRGLAFIEPPYPNPNDGQTVTLVVNHTISQGGPQHLRVMVVIDAGFVELNVLTNTAPPGAHVFSFNPSAILGESGLYRVLILDHRDELISYGDIMVQ